MLAEEIGARPPGSPANRRATDYAICELVRCGWSVRTHQFTTRWWRPGGGFLGLPNGAHVPVDPNPFSLVGTARGRVASFASLADLETAGDLTGVIVLLEEPLSGPVAPRHYPFYNPPEHQQLVRILEGARPAAVISVSSRAHSLPTFNDADLSLMSTTVGPETRALLAEGDRVTMTLGGETHAGEGVNVSATQGEIAWPRIVVCAHIDSAATTPGALDNAGGVAVLLALASSAALAAAPIELVLFNGEDHFDACGEMAWLAETDLSGVSAAINIDGAGLRDRIVEVSCLACNDEVSEVVSETIGRHPRMRMGEPWVESDHAIFAMRGTPSVAVTSANPRDVFENFVHTAADTRDVVDLDALADVVLLVEDLVRGLGALIAAGSRN